MEKIRKTIELPAWLTTAIQEEARREKRTFVKQVELLLEQAIKRHEAAPEYGGNPAA